MKHPDDTLATPLYVKSADDMKWPSHESVFHLLSGGGLFICRNNEFFSSSVPAPSFPASLADHRAFCQLRFAKVPRRMLELVVGYLYRIARLHGSEAGVLLAWDQIDRRYRLIVPRQVATVGRSAWDGSVYAVGLFYDAAPPLPPHLRIVGDFHSHLEGAYASSTDVNEEAHRPGLHVVVGSILSDPPDFHIDMVVDGMRFRVDPPLVLEGYQRRRTNVPQEWIDLVKVEVLRPARYSSGWQSSNSPHRSNGDS